MKTLSFEQVDLLSDADNIMKTLDNILAEVNVSREEAMKRVYPVNILVDTGNAAVGNVCDNVFNVHAYQYLPKAMPDGAYFSDNCSLDWLAKQQGKAGEVESAVEYCMEHGDVASIANCSKDLFTRSVISEWANCSQADATLTFFVKLTLEEILRILTIFRVTKGKERPLMMRDRKGSGALVLSKGSRCGLFADCSGGSLIGIQPVQDVILPLKNINYLMVDLESEDVSLHSVYGVKDDFWRATLKEILA